MDQNSHRSLHLPGLDEVHNALNIVIRDKDGDRLDDFFINRF